MSLGTSHLADAWEASSWLLGKLGVLIVCVWVGGCGEVVYIADVRVKDGHLLWECRSNAASVENVRY